MRNDDKIIGQNFAGFIRPKPGKKIRGLPLDRGGADGVDRPAGVTLLLFDDVVIWCPFLKALLAFPLPIRVAFAFTVDCFLILSFKCVLTDPSQGQD